MLVGGSVRKRGWAVVALASFLALAGIAPLAAGGAARDGLLVPPGFKLGATNGYSLTVFGFPADEDDPPSVYIIAGSPHSVVYYYSHAAEVTETSIKADLGPIAQIDMAFNPTGKPRSQKSACDRPTEFDSGRYEGSFSFHGEEGFAEAGATSARGDLQFILNIVCSDGFGEATGSHFPGASLRVSQGPQSALPVDGRPRIGFQVNKNKPAGRSTASAAIEEARGELLIIRGVFGHYPAGAFRYSPSLGSAGLHLAAPFSGSASFHRGGKGPRRWAGSLAVDFPGHSDVPLAGPGFASNLVHARTSREHIEHQD